MQNKRLSFLLAALALLGAGSAAAQLMAPPSPAAPAAQTAATATAAEAPPTRPERAVERVRIQDAGSRIDELRVGGETQTISVQPAGNAPAYEVRPANSAAPDSAGARFWNVLKF